MKRIPKTVYINRMNVSRVKKLHFSANVVSAVFYLSVHARHLLSLEAFQLSQKVFLQGLLLLLLGSQQAHTKKTQVIFILFIIVLFLSNWSTFNRLVFSPELFWCAVPVAAELFAPSDC